VTFEETGGASVRAMVDGRPFVVATPVGKGTLVLVADAAPLRNQWLDKGDAAVFTMDLVRAFGVPHIDERNHGMHLERGALRYLLHSAAVPALLGILLLGLVTVWHGNLWPARTAVTGATPAPTLDAFVDSLAQLYARTGDYARVAERYRQLTAARLRRHFGLPVETPLETLLDRPACQPPVGAGAEPGGARDAAGRGERRSPRRVVRALDTLVEDVTR
jgi:hypothetical protein